MKPPSLLFVQYGLKRAILVGAQIDLLLAIDGDWPSKAFGSSANQLPKANGLRSTLAFSMSRNGLAVEILPA